MRTWLPLAVLLRIQPVIVRATVGLKVALPSLRFMVAWVVADWVFNSVAGTIFMLYLLVIWFTKLNYFSVCIECTIAMSFTFLHFELLTYLSLTKVESQSSHLQILLNFYNTCPLFLLLDSFIAPKDFKSRTESKKVFF